MANIIVFKEKHGEYYYLAEDPDQRAKAFLDVLRSRQSDGYWYYEPTFYKPSAKPEEEAWISLTDDEVDALPSSVKETAQTIRSRYQRRLVGIQREYNQERRWWDEMVALLALPEDEAIKKTSSNRRITSLAEELMEARSDYQYETYDIISTEN